MDSRAAEPLRVLCRLAAVLSKLLQIFVSLLSYTLYTVLITWLLPTMAVAATSSTIQLLASTASYAFSSTAVPLARNRGSPVTRLTIKHVIYPPGRTVCYNRPLVRPRNYGLENGFTRSRMTSPSNISSRTNGVGGSTRKYTTQGANGTYYSSPGASSSSSCGTSETYTIFDTLFSTLLRGKRTLGKGKKKARLLVCRRRKLIGELSFRIPRPMTPQMAMGMDIPRPVRIQIRMRKPEPEHA